MEVDTIKIIHIFYSADAWHWFCSCTGKKRPHDLSEKLESNLNTCVYSPSPSPFSAPSASAWSLVHRVKLSRSSCMIRVESLYDSSLRVSSSAIASSKACLAIEHALSGALRIS